MIVGPGEAGGKGVVKDVSSQLHNFCNPAQKRDVFHNIKKVCSSKCRSMGVGGVVGTLRSLRSLRGIFPGDATTCQ